MVDYACATEERKVTLQLRHRDEGGTLRTDRFAVLTVVGEAPPGLLEAVAERIRRSESEWRWGTTGEDTDGSPGLAALERIAVPPGTFWLASAGYAKP
jgi:hypothetical protein